MTDKSCSTQAIDWTKHHDPLTDSSVSEMSHGTLVLRKILKGIAFRKGQCVSLKTLQELIQTAQAILINSLNCDDPCKLECLERELHTLCRQYKKIADRRCGDLPLLLKSKKDSVQHVQFHDNFSGSDGSFGWAVVGPNTVPDSELMIRGVTIPTFTGDTAFSLAERIRDEIEEARGCNDLNIFPRTSLCLQPTISEDTTYTFTISFQDETGTDVRSEEIVAELKVGQELENLLKAIKESPISEYMKVFIEGSSVVCLELKPPFAGYDVVISDVVTNGGTLIVEGKEGSVTIPNDGPNARVMGYIDFYSVCKCIIIAWTIIIQTQPTTFKFTSSEIIDNIPPICKWCCFWKTVCKITIPYSCGAVNKVDLDVPRVYPRLFCVILMALDFTREGLCERTAAVDSLSALNDLLKTYEGILSISIRTLENLKCDYAGFINYCKKPLAPDHRRCEVDFDFDKKC